MIAAKPFLAEGKQEGKNMERTNKLWILDSTLRDGAQGENISFSVQDKLRIVSALDQLGIDYIEAGNPASNPKDLEFFERVRALPLRHARLAAFGSTRRKDERAEDSEGLRALLQANTPAVCIFGKSWDFHVTHILHTTLEENLRMIEQSVAFLKANGREVIFDAEHFFDGYAWNPSYALASLDAAQRGGADCICLCETNGGAFPDQVAQVTAEVVQRLKAPVGIHTHNDGGMAVANSIVAVPEEQLKVGIVNPEMIADAVILDGEMIRRLPRKIAASTGIDALCHAIECYTSAKANPFSDLFAMQALRLIFANLEKACDDADALDAKEKMMQAAFYAGVAITCSGTTAVHALSYPLGGRYHIPHGVANAIMLMPVMQFNKSCCSKKFAEVYDAVGGTGAGTDTEKADWVINQMDASAGKGWHGCTAVAGEQPTHCHSGRR